MGKGKNPIFGPFWAQGGPKSPKVEIAIFELKYLFFPTGNHPQHKFECKQMLRIPIWANFGPMGPKKGQNRQKIAKFEKGLKNLPLDEYFIFSQKSIIYCVNNWNQE